jgi:glycosyltransferase involved in cell wall biosynthesis
LNYDQRMTRICNSLSLQYNIVLIGKKYARSIPLTKKTFAQFRIKCFFKMGKAAYIEFNLKLLFYLLFHYADCICAIDLDTIVPVMMVSTLKRCKRVYDAHELFTEMKEVVTRPSIQKVWRWVEKSTVPHFPAGYTVSQSISDIFNREYGVHYEVVRNMPERTPADTSIKTGERFILYQGAVNQGRALEYLIPAMKDVPARLIICGDGNFMKQAVQLVAQHHLTGKIIFKGMLLPEELAKITRLSYIGLNLVEPEGLNQLYSLANKFFDYIQACLPQVTMDFVEYARINNDYKIAVLISGPKPALIAAALNLLLDNNVLYKELIENCIRAREIFNWQNEEQRLLRFYEKIFGND